ncbi:hypothetical protein B0H19DRAFT_1275437 [Mycena capillaripes]|nr:hypothetical protein B0H19DRAFT_1275437 [Mycena capillaripes]
MSGAHGDSDSDSLRRLKTELLIQMDDSEYNDAGVLVIGATKIHWQMNSIKRTGGHTFPLPNAEIRQCIFDLHFSQSPCELNRQDCHSLVVQTEGYSRAEVAIVVQDTPMQPMRKSTHAQVHSCDAFQSRPEHRR